MTVSAENVELLGEFISVMATKKIAVLCER